MARKLKSDKVLFLATLLLALASVVMVYSASAVIAEERFHRPYLFLIKQSMWVGMGLAMLGLIMRVDYRTWKQPVLIWSALGLVLIASLGRGPSDPGLLRVAARLLCAGIVVFSGSLYALALGGPRLLGAITPLGGLAFMAGWAVLVWHALRVAPYPARTGPPSA